MRRRSRKLPATSCLGLGLFALSLTACSERTGPALGSLEVSVITSGYTADSDGYHVSLNGTDAASIEPQGSLSLPNLESGEYIVELAGVANNCRTIPRSKQVNVSPAIPAATTFQVICDSALRNVILFTRYTPGTEQQPGTADVFMIRPDGSGLARITSGSDARASPNGTRIVFTSQGSGVFSLKVDGTRLRDLTTETTEDQCPDWSPDGLRIAFSSKRSGEWQVHTMGPDGQDQARLTFSDRQEACGARWSPDGARIVFSRTLPGGASDEIIVIRADGTDEQQVSGDSPNGDSAPVWAPDGTRIVFNSARSGSNQLWIMNADGSFPQNLTNAEPFNHGLAVWSPDGQEVVFDRGGVNLPTLFKMRADGTNVTQLTFEPMFDRPSDWLP